MSTPGPDHARILSDNPDTIVVRQDPAARVVQTTKTQTVKVGTVGLAGPKGDTGPVGPAGPAGSGGIDPGAIAYEHVQNAVAAEWTINHNLGFRPNVYAFDSGRSAVEGEVEHLDKNTLVLRFAAGGLPTAFAGGAYLS